MTVLPFHSLLYKFKERDHHLHLIGLHEEKNRRENISGKKSLDGNIDCNHCCRPSMFHVRGLCTQILPFFSNSSINPYIPVCGTI